MYFWLGKHPLPFITQDTWGQVPKWGALSKSQIGRRMWKFKCPVSCEGFSESCGQGNWGGGGRGCPQPERSLAWAGNLHSTFRWLLKTFVNDFLVQWNAHLCDLCTDFALFLWRNPTYVGSVKQPSLFSWDISQMVGCDQWGFPIDGARLPSSLRKYFTSPGMRSGLRNTTASHILSR